jgi:hypothetical protein
MQLVLAYCMDADVARERIDAAVRRVADYHRGLCAVPVAQSGIAGPRLGLVAIDAARPGCTWPTWCEHDGAAVATAYAPLGWRRVIGEARLDEAPVLLARHLAAHPEEVGRLNPPFVVCMLDEAGATLTLITDGLGFGRLYAMRLESGWAWSNRLAALPIFAGVAPRIDERAWQYLAGCGWFMEDATPIAGVRAVGPATVIRCRTGGAPRIEDHSRAVLGGWVAPRSADRDAAALAAADLVELAESTATLWKAPPVVHLSGGRDSRVVAAAAVAAGVDATFRTVATLSEEGRIAKQLVSLAPRSLRHELVEERDVTTSGGLIDRAMALHRAYDGLYAPAGLKQSMHKGLRSRAAVVLNGAGGEIVRGNFYRAATYPRLESGGTEAQVAELDRLYRLHGGVREHVHEAVRSVIGETVEAGRSLGLEGVSLLDWFYLRERLRRWSNASATLGNFPPLATPTFIRAGFDLAPEARIRNEVQLEVIGALCPAWQTIDFYKAQPGATSRITRPRLWESSDAAAVDEILASPADWDEHFDADAVRRIWSGLKAGEESPRHEPLLQRLVWLATYGEHVRSLARAAGL